MRKFHDRRVAAQRQPARRTHHESRKVGCHECMRRSCQGSDCSVRQRVPNAPQVRSATSHDQLSVPTQSSVHESCAELTVQRISAAQCCRDAGGCGGSVSALSLKIGSPCWCRCFKPALTFKSLPHCPTVPFAYEGLQCIISVQMVRFGLTIGMLSSCKKSGLMRNICAHCPELTKLSFFCHATSCHPVTPADQTTSSA
jgi:hypothetical protein